MLCVEMRHSVNALIVRLEGRVTDDGAEYVGMLVTRCNTERGLVVGLTEV
jgi:hypothetical protein